MNGKPKPKSADVQFAKEIVGAILKLKPGNVGGHIVDHWARRVAEHREQLDASNVREHANDLASAVAMLAGSKHWRVQCLNSVGRRRRHECTIWGDGRRVSASAGTPLDAIRAALKKLHDKTTGTGLKIVRADK